MTEIFAILLLGGLFAIFARARPADSRPADRDCATAGACGKVEAGTACDSCRFEETPE